MTKFIDISETEKKEKKETVFTHEFVQDGIIANTQKPNSFNKIVYLGNCVYDGDMFACYEANTISIFKGIKGDEFD